MFTSRSFYKAQVHGKGEFATLGGSPDAIFFATQSFEPLLNNFKLGYGILVYSRKPTIIAFYSFIYLYRSKPCYRLAGVETSMADGGP
jgi:hypothetical protein